MQLFKLGKIATATFLLLASGAALAEYPDHPIKLIVPYAPGGSSDIVGRQVAQFLGEAIGQSVVVENIGGGGGAIGVQRAAQAPADGYTLLLGANSELLINKLLRPELTYDAVRDFTPLASIGTGSIVIIGKPSLKASTMQEVIALARTKPGGLDFGSSGNGTIQHLVGEMIKLRTKAPLEHVAYRGAGPLATDVAGDHVDLGIATLASAKPLIDTGKVKAFAISADRRSEFAPQIPAVSDTPQLSNFTLETWYGVFAPAKLPAPIAAKLQQTLQAVVDNPELAKNLAKQAISISKMPAKDLTPFLVKETEKFKTVITDAKVKLQ